MKKMFHRNQIAITSLAVLIAIAGYLNFTQNDIPTISQNTGQEVTGRNKTSGDKRDSGTEKASKEKPSEKTDQNKPAATEKKEEETLASAGSLDISDADSLISEKVDDPAKIEDEETIGDAVLTQAQVGEYIAGAKMEREQTHSKTKDALNQIIENEKLSEDAKQEAATRLERLADTIEKEAAVEQLLKSKGYGQAVVSIGEDSIDVILNYKDLDQSDRAQIEDIVTRKTGCQVSQIVISRMRVSSPDNR